MSKPKIMFCIVWVVRRRKFAKASYGIAAYLLSLYVYQFAPCMVSWVWKVARNLLVLTL